MRNVAIAGVGMTDVGIFEDVHPFELALSAILDAIADSRLEKREIGAVFATKTGYMVDNYMFVPQRMSEYLQIPTRVAGEVDCGGASALVALRHVALEIATGRIDAGLVFASHWELTPRYLMVHHAEVKHLVRVANGVYGSYDSRLGVLSPIPYYAMCQQRYMRECDVTLEQIAALPVVLRDFASNNPRAMHRKPITVEDVLSSTMLCPPIRLLDSCPLAHGAAAVVLASEEKARQVTGNAVVITGYGEAHDETHFMPYVADMSHFPAVERSAAEAYDTAGVRPADIQVAEVYGAFAGPELMCYEELGFFERGEAPAAVEAGRTRLGGEVVINTSGGRLSLGHPAFATPLLEVFEVVTQLRGGAGERQVPGAKLGLVQAEHGMVNGSVVLIMEAD
jgi:acetyl-CoA acetyltransferase